MPGHIQVETPGERIVLSRDSQSSGEYGISASVGNGQRLGASDKRQANESNAIGIASDTVGELAAVFDPARGCSQRRVTQDQGFKRVPGPGLFVAGVKNDDSRFCPAQLAPVIDFAIEGLADVF